MARPVDAKTRRAQHEEREFAERYGTPAARAPLTTAPDAPPSIAKRAGKGIVGWFKTAAITLGTFWVLGLAAVTFWTTNRVSNRWRPSGVSQRMGIWIAAAQPGLAHRLPFDSSISPDAAGAAASSFRRTLGSDIGNPGITPRRVAPAGMPWRSIPLPFDVFDRRVSRPNSSTGLPSSPEILRLARGPLNAQQREVLRLVGTAPVWEAVDLVARAPRVDFVGGRFVLPFGDQAWALTLPGINYIQMRDIGHASLVRAAWHLSEGRRDAAEHALRSLISLGAAMMDFGPTSGELEAGASLVRIGSDGLGRMWQLAGDSRGAALIEAASQAAKAGETDPRFQTLPRGDLAGAERRLIALVSDPTVPRAIKPELGRLLESVSCGSVSGLFRGPTGAAKEALDAMRRDYVRLPSDREVLKLFDNEMSRPWPEGARSIAGASGTANFIGSVFFSRRLGTCAMTATGFFGPFR